MPALDSFGLPEFTSSAFSARPLPDAPVSMPLAWDEVEACDPAEFTVFTAPQRFAQRGNPHADMDARAFPLEPLLELAARDQVAELQDAPWPPHYRKVEGEAPRVAPSRAREPAGEGAGDAAPRRTAARARKKTVAAEGEGEGEAKAAPRGRRLGRRASSAA